MFSLRRNLEQSKRLRQIISVFVSYGFEGFMRSIGLYGGFRIVRKAFGKKTSRFRENLTRWQRIRMVLEELGPTFIKFGQLLSSRRDMLPIELIEELELLQDNVAPFSGDVAWETVRRELGESAERFEEFDREPIASASIAQVHTATVTGIGEVAVKVRRPKIDSMVRSDVRIMKRIAQLTERYIVGIRPLAPISLVREFERHINHELDMNQEFLNIKRLSAHIGTSKDVHVPEVYEELTSREVLTLEYIKGRRISEILQRGTDRMEGKALARRLTDLLLSQIFEYGFFHADPHPGNLIILEDLVVCYLDFGMMGRISPSQRDALGMLMYGISQQLPNIVVRALLSLTHRSNPLDEKELELRAYELIEEYAALPLEYFNMGNALNDLLALIVHFDLILPSNLLYLIKALIAAEGISRRLDPGFNLLVAIEPFAIKLVRNEFSFNRLKNEMLQSARDYRDLAVNAPTDIRDIMTVLKDPRIRLHLDEESLQATRTIAGESSNKFVFGIILASLLISSSLIVVADVSPKWNDVPIIGLIGYLFSGLIGFGLIGSMLLRAFRRR